MENNNIIKNDENKPSLRKVIHNIRNMLELTEEEKEFIKSINDDEKMELILEYNRVLQSLVRSMYECM
jgi:hypothetical protein